jgi:hypothetical protein
MMAGPIAKAAKEAAFHATRQEEVEGTVVGSDAPRVLLLRYGPPGLCTQVDWLQRFGCDCHTATSIRDAVALLDEHPFLVVLSEFHVCDSSTRRLIAQLAGSTASLFFCLEVEDGCWWLPAIMKGQECWGSRALNSRDFHQVLNRLLSQETSI